MSIKFLASEFSSKVKACNSIEENILRNRLHAYKKQEKTNLRMIEKDTKKFQEDFNEKLRVAKNNYLNNENGTGDVDSHDEVLAASYRGGGHLSDQTHQISSTIHRDKPPRKRRKKKSSSKREKDKKSTLTSDTITNETFLYKSVTDGELGELQKATQRYRSPCFLPRLDVKNNTELTSAKPTKSNGYLSLPPIKNSGLTTSVSLPSLNRFNKKH